MGLKKAGHERHPGRFEQATHIDLDKQQRLFVTSLRFYQPRLEGSDDMGSSSLTLPCANKDAFLAALEASEDHLATLEGADLSLVITASFDVSLGKTCTLVAEWPAADTGSTAAVKRADLFRFIATPQAATESQSKPVLTIAGPFSSGCTHVEADSPEHADIAAIADFFLPPQ